MADFRVSSESGIEKYASVVKISAALSNLGG
jgi:hypothetical protein